MIQILIYLCLIKFTYFKNQVGFKFISLIVLFLLVQSSFKFNLSIKNEPTWIDHRFTSVPLKQKNVI